MADEVFLPIPVAAMLVGNPDSELTEEARDQMAESMLLHMQDDMQAMAQWEIYRAEANTDDERTVQDLTVADVREICENLFRAVHAGHLPDPMGGQVVHGALPEGELTELDAELFNQIALGVSERLVESHFLSLDADGDPSVEPDFYVMLAGSLMNVAQNLKAMGCLAEGLQVDETIRIMMQMFALHLQVNRPL